LIRRTYQQRSVLGKSPSILSTEALSAGLTCSIPDYSHGEIIEVSVSDGQDSPFGVYKDYLTRSSGYLQSPCSGLWMKDRKIKAPMDMSYEDLKVYIHWLYSAEIELGTDR
jgi:hypothetical protein